MWRHLKNLEGLQTFLESGRTSDLFKEKDFEHFPTETDWILLRDSLFSHSQRLKNSEKERKSIQSNCEDFIDLLETTFQARAVLTAATVHLSLFDTDEKTSQIF